MSRTILLVFAFSFAGSSVAQTINIYAGTDTGTGFNGDGIPATIAQLYWPHGIAVRANGDLYIADRENHRIRKVDAATGLISTVAGNGSPGFSGDGGPATSASLGQSGVQDVAVDGAGNLYIADISNQRVRRVDATTGIIVTVAGNGTAGFSGNDGPATAASLNTPYSVSVDVSGNLYISDLSNNCIRKVTVATGVISAAAGVCGAGFAYGGDGGPALNAYFWFPAGVDVDPSGNLYITDYGNHRIRRVDAATGLISTVAGNGIGTYSGDGGPATSASIRLPSHTALDANGNLYIADTFNQRIRMVAEATGIITTVAGSGGQGSSGDGGPATAATFYQPFDVAFDASGRMFIADTLNSRVRVVGSLTVADQDADGVPDATDDCSAIANPDQTDTDLDGHGDACDLDNDNDGIADTSDNCKFSPNANQADQDGDGLGNVCDSDPDGDSVVGAADNCPLVPNGDQTNTDGDGLGDDCDTDDDNDAVCDIDATSPGCSGGPDNCPTIHNTDQQDLEGDGIGDACDADLDNDAVMNTSDNCPVDANVDQNDADGDGQGDVCDSDIDNDSVTNGGDNCPYVANTAQGDLDHDGAGDACDADVDGDGIATTGDNCPTIANSDQSNFDGDGSGDACDLDVDGDSVVNGTDQCGLTPMGTTVDPLNGCSLVQLCPCSGPAGTTVPWKNHGKYVSCVAHVAGDFAASGLITQAQKDALVSSAGQSNCGK